MTDEVERPAAVTRTHLKYLDNLRESGETNMFGAAPYLQYEFCLSKKDATMILLYWIRTFQTQGGEVEYTFGGE